MTTETKPLLGDVAAAVGNFAPCKDGGFTATLSAEEIAKIPQDGKVELVVVPSGLSASDVQHRLATWEGLRDALEGFVMIADFANVEFDTTAFDDLATLGRAALAAAKEQLK